MRGAVPRDRVAVAGRPADHFGAIFCDREAERFRRVAGARGRAAAAQPAARRRLPAGARPELSQDAYIVWDLIHDRAHSHGDLPFDPFMIRQRSAVLDVLARGAALRPDRVRRGGRSSSATGFAFARYVQYAILFDRLFRFPITGPRVRNYDGLGGQLLFAFLHTAAATCTGPTTG